MTKRRHGEGSLTERNGHWRSTILNPRTGRPVQRTWPFGTTKKQAEKLHREWQVETDLRRSVVDHRTSVKAYLNRWQRNRKADMAPATWRAHRSRTVTLTRHFGAMKLVDLNAMVVTDVFADIAAQYSPATVKNLRDTLTLALSDAVAWGLLHTNPTANARLPRAAKKDRATPTTAQVHALCDGEPNPFWRSLWETLAGTGCRPGEALALRWADIDLEQRAISITRTVTLDTDGVVMMGDATKTRRPRKVTVDQHLAQVLAGWRAELAARNLADAGPQALLWASADSRSGAVDNHTMARAFKAGMARAGGDPAVTPHAIRHWFVSTLVAAGVPAQTIATQTGHSIGEIHRRYGVHAPADQMLAVTQHLPARTIKDVRH